MLVGALHVIQEDFISSLIGLGVGSMHTLRGCTMYLVACNLEGAPLTAVIGSALNLGRVSVLVLIGLVLTLEGESV